MSGTVQDGPRWYAALTYALVGQIPSGLEEPGRFELDEYLAQLATVWLGGLDGLRTQIQRTGEPGVRAVPAELTAGLPPAQLLGAFRAVRSALGLGAAPRRVRQDQPIDAHERRLQEEVPRTTAIEIPPHHGD